MAANLTAPAKINLYLRVGPKSSVGLHSITSVMTTLSLADEISITTANRLSLFCDVQELSGEQNLALQAARQLRRVGAITSGAQINLTKKIPTAAGLGGGSSDAAAVLKYLNVFWKINLPQEKLSEIALALGSDVPFFLKGGLQLVEGYGDVTKPLKAPVLSRARFVLAKPPVALSAGRVYDVFDALPAQSAALSAADFMSALAADDLSKLAAVMFNDLEPAVLKLSPPAAALKKIAMENGALKAMVSGSGPTIFALADSESAARRIYKALAPAAEFSTIAKPAN